MSQNSDIQRNIQLKGVIPPPKSFPEGFWEALKDLRKFPGLAEEVRKYCEEQSRHS
jgi:hypothetical protein